MGQRKNPPKSQQVNQEPKDPVLDAVRKASFSPTTIDQIMGKVTSSNGEGLKKIRRRGCTIPIFPEQCAPGILDEVIKVSLQELSSDQELNAYRSAGGINVSVGEEESGDSLEEFSISQQALAVAFGHEALLSINGRKLTSDERTVVWEIFGMTGRLAIGTAYMAHCTGATGGFLQRSLSMVEIW